MARDTKTVYKSYIEDGESWMICRNSIEGGKYWTGKYCGEWVNVTSTTTAVLCHRCVNRVTEPPKFTPRYKPTGRPKGWQWMNEFVDNDGNVFRKGKEHPELKGKFPATVIESKKDKKRSTKREREAQKRTSMAALYDLKKQLKKATLKKDIKSIESQIKKLSRKLKIKLV
tara:strand:+ start:1054 stop:1566 length:513 start_codon:yes stop_codon:yes gene_type:complete